MMFVLSEMNKKSGASKVIYTLDTPDCVYRVSIINNPKVKSCLFVLHDKECMETLKTICCDSLNEAVDLANKELEKLWGSTEK